MTGSKVISVDSGCGGQQPKPAYGRGSEPAWKSRQKDILIALLTILVLITAFSKNLQVLYGTITGAGSFNAEQGTAGGSDINSSNCL